MSDLKIVYTLTDEAPALATYSLLPFIKKYGVEILTMERTRPAAAEGIFSFAQQVLGFASGFQQLARGDKGVGLL